jgi:hypothetical protein
MYLLLFPLIPSIHVLQTDRKTIDLAIREACNRSTETSLSRVIKETDSEKTPE